MLYRVHLARPVRSYDRGHLDIDADSPDDASDKAMERPDDCVDAEGFTYGSLRGTVGDWIITNIEPITTSTEAKP
jgi:hypothetical protein